MAASKARSKSRVRASSSRRVVAGSRGKISSRGTKGEKLLLREVRTQVRQLRAQIHRHLDAF